VYSFKYAQTLLLSRIWLFEAKEIESLLFENNKKFFEWEAFLCFVYNFAVPQLVEVYRRRLAKKSGIT
jgi:hypothetical protein